VEVEKKQLINQIVKNLQFLGKKEKVERSLNKIDKLY